MEDEYRKLLESDRVTTPTRKVLITRAEDHKNAPKIGTPASDLGIQNIEVLTSLINVLIPQDKLTEQIDIVSMLLSKEETAVGDGWRFADMPPDKKALPMGLTQLQDSAFKMHGAAFDKLLPEQQRELLKKLQLEELVWPGLNAVHWFQDILAATTECFVSHPATLSKIGFSGIAFLPRWDALSLQQTQKWEPREE